MGNSDREIEGSPREQSREPVHVPAGEAASMAEGSAGSLAASLLSLQRSVGNAATGALLAGAQRKLHVGASRDSYELEADEIARSVVARLERRHDARASDSDREEIGAREPEQHSVGGVAEVGTEGGEVPKEAEDEIRSARGDRTPLDAATRADMEGGFGEDFSDVRVHTGAVGRLAHAGSAIRRAAVVQRLVAPGIVRKNKAAGLHKYEETEEGDKVQKGGITGSGFNIKAPEGATVLVDPDKRGTDTDYIWGEYGDRTGYIREASVEKGVRLADTTLYYLPEAEGTWVIYDTESKSNLASGLTKEQTDYLDSVLTRFSEFEKASHIHVDDQRGVVKSILKDTKQLKALGDGPWKEAVEKVRNVVVDRATKDKALLVTAGLITDGHVLTSLRFTGSDFHKGGQQVVFLEYKKDGKDDRRVVYKPSSLMMDAALFGTGDSVAKVLDSTGGDRISQYNIIPATGEKGEDKGYGYMEFVKSSGPTDKADLLLVYKSIAANMAMSYLVGMEDIHQENVLLLKDRIQVIDMESTSGVFREGSEKGFSSQLWAKAIGEGIKPKLLERVGSGQLTTLPSAGEIPGAMDHSFKAVLSRARHSQKSEVSRLGGKLEEMKSRCVPIETAALQQFIHIVSDGKYTVDGKRESYTLEVWKRRLEDDEKKGKTEDRSTLVEQAQGQTSNDLKALKRILASPGTFGALKKGDVPYYTRDLGSSDIFDEQGNKIDGTGLVMVGENIKTEMESRRDASPEERDEIVKLFTTQGVGWITELNEALIARHAATS